MSVAEPVERTSAVEPDVGAVDVRPVVHPGTERSGDARWRRARRRAVALLRGRRRSFHPADRALRVALVTDGLYPYFKGGKEVRIHELAHRVARHEVSVDIYTMRWWDGGATREEDGVTLHALCRSRPLYTKGRRSIPQALLFAAACTRVARAHVDVIDADQMPYFPLLPLRIVAWAKRVPMVVTWHEWWGRAYWRQYLGPAGLVAAALERFVARLGDHLVVHTAETARRLVDDGIPAERISVLPLGVDEDAIAAATPAATPCDVSYVGRLLEHKHVDLLIEAIASLRDSGLRLTCAIVGEGPEGDALRSMVGRLDLDDQVSFLGRLEEQHEVWGVMKRSRVFAYPSTREGFGVAVLEAAACGATVVTADHPDNYARNLVDVGVSGVLADQTVESMASAIRAALAIADRRSGDDERRPVPSWSSLAEELLEIYRQSCAA